MCHPFGHIYGGLVICPQIPKNWKLNIYTTFPAKGFAARVDKKWQLSITKLLIS